MAPEAKFCRDCGTQADHNDQAAVATAAEEAATEVRAGATWPTAANATVTPELHTSATPAPSTAIEFSVASPEQPTSTAVMSVTPSSPPVSTIAEGRRPTWLVPLIVGVGLLVIVGAAGAAYLAGRSGSPSFTAQAQKALNPVLAADQRLSARVSAVQTHGDLSAVGSAAAADVTAITVAQGAASVIANGKSATAVQLLNTALTSDLAYAKAVKNAAGRLTAGLASASQTAGQQAGQAYASMHGAAPKLVVPAASLYLPTQQLVTLADEQQKAAAAAAAKRQQKAATTGAIRSYVRSIDSLLRNSADTRSNLGTLIGDVQSNQVDYAQASSEISSIINQRQDLENQVSGVQAPAAFAQAAASLRQSISAALQDDYAIQSWINAWYSNDQVGFDNAYSQHEEATATATSDKAAFLAAYNRLRSRYLQLPPLDVAY